MIKAYEYQDDGERKEVPEIDLGDLVAGQTKTEKTYCFSPDIDIQNMYLKVVKVGDGMRLFIDDQPAGPGFKKEVKNENGNHRVYAGDFTEDIKFEVEAEKIVPGGEQSIYFEWEYLGPTKRENR